MKKVKIAQKTKYNDYIEDEDNLAIIINIRKCKICLTIIFVIFILCILYYFIFSFHKKEYKNYVNVSYAFDGNYHYITHVSMKSIMLSQDKTTFINFYMLVSNITDEQKEVINIEKINI